MNLYFNKSWSAYQKLNVYVINKHVHILKIILE